MRIERQDVITYGTPLLFIGAACLAGSRRLIKHFPGSSQKGLVCSAALGGAGVVASGLKNSGDGCDYDRRVYIIAVLAVTVIAAPTLAKTLLGRADLNFRASLRFAFIQGLIFGVVDFGSSFMEKADAMPLIEPEPEADVPPPQQQNYIGAVTVDVLSLILQCLGNVDIAKVALTCKRFQEVVETQQIQTHLAEQFAFGPKDWNRYFVDIGEVPPLPHDIIDILKSPCPYWPNSRVLETHLLVLLPQTVNEQSFTLGVLGKLAGYTNLLYTKVEQGLSKSYWVLITKAVIPNSRSKNYTEQQALLQGIYAVPRTLEIATGILMHHAKTGERLYSKTPFITYTRCQENYDGECLSSGSRIMVGSFGESTTGSSELAVTCFDHDDSRRDSYGLGGVRKL